MWNKHEGEPRRPGPGRDDDQPGDGADGAGPDQACAALQAQIDELNSKYLRTLADYQNSQRRAVANEREAREQGIRSIVLNVLPVLDHFDLALAQNQANTSSDQIVAGVKVIRDELMKVLQTHGVAPIAPAPGEEFDPNRHKAVTHQPSDSVAPGQIVSTLQTGYALGERVVRPAMVAVAAEPASP